MFITTFNKVALKSAKKTYVHLMTQQFSFLGMHPKSESLCPPKETHKDVPSGSQ